MEEIKNFVHRSLCYYNRGISVRAKREIDHKNDGYDPYTHNDMCLRAESHGYEQEETDKRCDASSKSNQNSMSSSC